jgi:predicted ATP-dependent endonuclease of OLD family
LRIEPSDAVAVYIADEPEMHLHPAAIASARDWLTELAQTAATVLVASHSPILLNGDSQLVNRVLVRATEEGTKLQTLSGAWADDLARVKGELGLTAGDLLLMTRLAVFVEGPHDVIVLDTWFGEELRSAGIRIFPIHGADQLPHLVESEIVAALGIRIATLTDQTDVTRARSGKPATRGERAVTRLLREAKRSGRQVKAVGCSQPDILYYLDEEVCRRAAPEFPGWRTAYDAAQKAGRATEWKLWVSSQYDLDLSRDNIRRLALECKEQRLIPAELAGRIRALTAYAAKPLAHRDKRRS